MQEIAAFTHYLLEKLNVSRFGGRQFCGMLCALSLEFASWAVNIFLACRKY